MSTVLWIVIIAAALVVLALLLVSARKGSQARKETRRGEAHDMRREARMRGARADRVQAEAEERAARARREAAIAEEQSAHAEREQRFAHERHAEADRHDPDVSAKDREGRFGRGREDARQSETAGGANGEYADSDRVVDERTRR